MQALQRLKHVLIVNAGQIQARQAVAQGNVAAAAEADDLAGLEHSEVVEMLDETLKEFRRKRAQREAQDNKKREMIQALGPNVPPR